VIKQNGKVGYTEQTLISQINSRPWTLLSELSDQFIIILPDDCNGITESWYFQHTDHISYTLTDIT
jgi:hypothetical protein